MTTPPLDRRALSASITATRALLAAALTAAVGAAQARVGVDLQLAMPMAPRWLGAAGPSAVAGPTAAVGLGVGWRNGRGHRYGRHWHGSRGGFGLWLAPTIVWPLTVSPAPAIVVASPPPPLEPPLRPEPTVESRHGQDAQQLEADRRDCDRWATTQPAAMADADVFHRVVAVCLDGRGYTVR